MKVYIIMKEEFGVDSVFAVFDTEQGAQAEIEEHKPWPRGVIYSVLEMEVMS